MVRNGNGLVSPFIGSFYDILCFGDTIHITHLGVTMKLYSLSCCRVHTTGSKVRNLLYAGNRTNSQLMVELIHHADTFDFYKST